ncbi:methyl-accepting chemotaxis protein [Solidesulfovibrio magneticus]|uniref:Methyl-accepting chemotaxis protein n=1 Tax=Solidesulfovibrio magneticus (strain ATCC 700980 / DSM 13731 / RS-1) TaxID=573370 RepID=C4XPI6_SOLM1|nr:methyl-accepting chemotaxis protein [Solidesulfovibrio magneticus]BAH75167.1 methyl-accepting chemotaxis protein [Solidesulfovibrio magneticus RS-1]
MGKSGITTIIAASVAATILAGVAALVIYVAKSSFTMIENVQESGLEQTAALTARAADIYLKGTASVLDSLAAQDEIKAVFSGNKEETQRLLLSFIKNHKDFFSFTVFDTSGKIVAGYNSNGQDISGGDRKDRDYVKAILAGQDTVHSRSVFQSGSGSELIYVVAKSLRGPDGKLLGGVAAAPLWGRFTAAIMDPIRFGKRGYGFMVDSDGNFISHPDQKLLLQSFATNPTFKAAMDKGSGTFDYLWNGERKAMAVARIPSTDWLVCMSYYTDEMTTLAGEQRNTLVALGLGVAALAVAVIVLITRRLVLRPLLCLSNFTAKVAGGDFDAAIQCPLRAELAAFGENLRQMVAELKAKLGFAQGVLNGIPSPCGIVGPDFNMLWHNEEISRLLDKYEPGKSFVGQTSGQFYLNDPAKNTLSDRAIQERRMLAAENDFTTVTGRKLRIAIRTTPFYDLDGTLLGSISFWNDITELYEQKQQIEEKNAVIAQTAASASAVADRVAAASEELSAQIEQSSRGAEEQNGRVQETATAVEEMNATIIEVARNAAATAGSAELARDKARGGAKLVADVESAVGSIREEAVVLTDNMRSLGDQAKGIGAIMDVISDIADQTNLLALNAAIEAARAGEAGRGFAVVADEVRKLAEKTMNATKEVGQAIAGIQRGTADAVSRVERAVSKVETASGLAEKSEAALTEIVSVVEAAGDQVRAIATAAEQQSATSDEINRSVESISSIAHETAQAMHQSAQAVSDLARQAQELNSLMVSLGSANDAPRALGQ